jgi:EAL domain-containing protein (putative c-di-GMP-specific phosphodiesterase class I)
MQSVCLDGIEVTVDAAIGISLAPEHADSGSALLRMADEAMHAAKSLDGAAHVFDGEDEGDPAPAPPPVTDTSRPAAADDPARAGRIALLTELRRAISSRELTVFVQPQARTETGEVYGVEALIRWEHPRLGLLSPADFLDLAERHGLTHELTAGVLDRSVAAAARWGAAGHHLDVSVNLSPRSLLNASLQETVEDTLRRYRLPPSRLTLEITEGSVMSQPERAVAVLEALRDSGVKISVDDFGTGYSSLSYLRRLPVHEVKIDRSFVTNLTREPGDLVIVRSITDLAANLSLSVVAEGVEDDTVWDQLRRLGCGAVQGFRLARPMPVDDLAPWLSGYRTRLRGARDGEGARPPHLQAVPTGTAGPGTSGARWSGRSAG